MKRLPSQSVRVWLTLAFLSACVALARANALGPTGELLLIDIRNDGPNLVGLDLITQNYYEELLKPDREAGRRDFRAVDALIRTLTGHRARPDFDPLAVLASVPHETGFLESSLEPNLVVDHRGVTVRTNRWGHRDESDYEQAPEHGVFRIAIVGSSNSLGLGVEYEESFKHLLEQSLNESLPAEGGFERYEIVNLSVQGYHLLERVYVASNIAPSFHPHLILVEVTMLDMRRSVFASLARRVHEGRDLGFDYLREIVRRSGAGPGDSLLKIEQRLSRFTDEIVIGSFQQLARVQSTLGTPVVPMLLRLDVDSVHPNLVRMAAIAEGLDMTVLRVFDAYEGTSGSDMYLSPRDFHPTPTAHALIAKELHWKLLASPELKALLLGEQSDRASH